jgi:membrane protease YdiL (CAAX protease family)
VIETLRIAVAGGFFMLLVLLRFEAEHFGAAEYDEPKGRNRTGLWTRLSWYALGLALVAAIYVVHPYPHDDLYLVGGHRQDVLIFGIVLAVIGAAQAGAFAWFRYGDFRLPPATAYPGAGLNALATSVIDEAAFRGALLGTLITVGVPAGTAVLVQAVVYVLVTRLGESGRHPYMLLLSVGIGLAAGWATVSTGGIGAAILAHAVTSFALFVCTGHAGQVTLRGRDPEELEGRRRVPEGWLDARRVLRTGHGAEPLGLIDVRTPPAPAAPLPEPRNLGPARAIQPEPAVPSELPWFLAEDDAPIVPSRAGVPSEQAVSVRRGRSPRRATGE